jgi:hypothetical protein
MKKIMFFCVWCVMSISLILSTLQAQEPVRKDLQKSVYLELFGNGGLGSINYEREVVSNIFLRVGVGFMPSLDAPMSLRRPNILQHIQNTVKAKNEDYTFVQNQVSFWLMTPITVSTLVPLGNGGSFIEFGAGIIPNLEFSDFYYFAGKYQAGSDVRIELSTAKNQFFNVYLTTNLAYRYQAPENGLVVRIGFMPMVRFFESGTPFDQGVYRPSPSVTPWGGASIGWRF